MGIFSKLASNVVRADGAMGAGGGAGGGAPRMSSAPAATPSASPASGGGVLSTMRNKLQQRAPIQKRMASRSLSRR